MVAARVQAGVVGPLSALCVRGGSQADHTGGKGALFHASA